MKTINEVSSDKLRGGFYTPASLVSMCLDRVSNLCGDRYNLAVLEPSVGDGAFLQGLARHRLAIHVDQFLGLDIIEAEVQKCRSRGHDAPFTTRILTRSAVDWAVYTEEQFDIVIGNPPFVRFQFVSQEDLDSIEKLGQRIGIPFRGVSNLWIPILLSALDRLRPGGSMAVVIPAEVFTGVSAGVARKWLLANFESLRIDMFVAGSFPNVLQEVVILSGKKEIPSRHIGFDHETPVTFVEHSGSGAEEQSVHYVPFSPQSWTRYLLPPACIKVLTYAQGLEPVQRFGDVAKLEVSIVTGANNYFSVDAEQLERFELQQWAVPLLPKIRHAKGLIYSDADHKIMIAEGAKAWLLNFSDKHPDPVSVYKASEYIAVGETSGLHKRYKTSIRTPWYRVPSIRSGKLMLSKRSHWFPRLVINDLAVVTTDTIYRGSMLPLYEGRDLDLVAGFHNSLTLLTAELEGRSFGGGVLELVPSEIARLSVPFPISFAKFVPTLDAVARHMSTTNANPEALIEATDQLMVQHVPGFTEEIVWQLGQARKILLQRRLSRN